MCVAGLSRARLQATGGGVLGWNGSVEAEEESVTFIVLHETPCVTLHCYVMLHLIKLLTVNYFEL